MNDFIKFVRPEGWDLQEPALVKIASGGLRGNDLRAFAKRAGAQLAQELRKLAFAPGEEALHVAALGALETFGANRNGDGFRAGVCRHYHPTYTKYGRFYRSHKNTDPARSYGVVKHSTFNEDMQRVDLIVALNGTKEAAERNGGLVADRELDKLNRGDTIPTSMACRVSHDCCSSCGNKARNRTEYCTVATCKHGGLQDHMGRVCDDGHQLHADNPDPHWFDISHVTRNADRISYGMGLDRELAKQAAALQGGRQLADVWAAALPDHVGQQLLGLSAWRQRKLAHALAGVEGQITHLTPEPLWRLLGGHKIAGAATWPRRELLPALAAARAILGLEDFLALEGSKEAATEVRAALPGSFTRLCRDPYLELTLADNPYTCAGEPVSGAVARWAHKQAAACQAPATTFWKLALQSPSWRLRPVPPAPPHGPDTAARQYALYKLATAEYWSCHGLADAGLLVALAAGPYLLDACASA